MKIHPDRYVCYYGRKEVNLQCDTCQYCKIHGLILHKDKPHNDLNAFDTEISDKNIDDRLKEGFALLQD